jgi:hypothetical protein
MFPFQMQHGQIMGRNTNMASDADGNYLGKVRVVENSDGTLRYDVWLYNATGAALTAGRPYMTAYGATIPTLLSVAVPATSAYQRYVVFATEATAEAGYGWFAFAGYVYDLVLVNDAGVIVGDPLEVINAGTYLIEDAAESALTVAIALEIATGSTVARDVFLPGLPITIAAA